jgi:hypothetical protein
MANLFAHHVAERVLQVFTRNLPPDLQPWGDAMLAEIPAVKGSLASLTWALGASLFLGRTLAVRWFSEKWFSGKRFSGKGLHQALLDDQRSGSPFQKIALLAAALSFAMLLSPTFRQAITTGMTAWSTFDRPGDPPDVQRAAALAQKQQNAHLMAAVALHLRDQKQSSQLAENAVKLDPRLTWIWYPLIERFVPEGDAGRRLLTEKTQLLTAWDATNAISWILDAHRIRIQQGGNVAAVMPPVMLVQGDFLRLTKWRTNMEHAFAAPRFDDYFEQRMELERELEMQLGVSNPFVAVDTMEHLPLAPLEELRLFANIKLSEGDRAMEQGHLDQALALYREPQRFAVNMRARTTGLIQKFYTDGLQSDAEVKLASALKRAGRDSAAEELLQQVALRKSERPDFSKQKDFWASVYGPVAKTGIIVSIASALAVFTLAVVLLACGYFFTVRWTGVRSVPATDRRVVAIIRYSQLVLLAACLTLYWAYRPYREIYSRFLNGSSPSPGSDGLRNFWQFRYLPNLVISALGGSDLIKVWAWSACIALLGIPIAIIFWRSFSPRKHLFHPD